MKFYLINFFLLCCCFSVAQSYLGHGIVKYVETHRSDLTTHKAFSLYFNSGKSFYEESILGRSRIDTTFTKIVNGTIVFEEHVNLGKNRTEPFFYYFDKREGKMIYREYLGDKTQIVIDSLDEIKWILTEETKDIGGFNCQKAVGFFRGREYEVWFTTQIPVSFGPWKLNGLGGLILEVREKSGKYEAKAVLINLSPDKDLVEVKIFPPSTKNALSFIEFYTKQNEDLVQLRKQIAASSPKGVTFSYETESIDTLGLEIIEH